MNLATSLSKAHWRTPDEISQRDINLDPEIINSTIQIVGDLIRDRMKPIPTQIVKLNHDIKLSSLEHVYEQLSQFNGEFKCDGDQISDNLSQFLSHEYDDDEYPRSALVNNGEIKTIYYEPDGQGGSESVTRIFKHNNIVIEINYCGFGELNDFHTNVTFSLLNETEAIPLVTIKDYV